MNENIFPTYWYSLELVDGPSPSGDDIVDDEDG